MQIRCSTQQIFIFSKVWNHSCIRKCSETIIFQAFEEFVSFKKIKIFSKKTLFSLEFPWKNVERTLVKIENNFQNYPTRTFKISKSDLIH